MQQNCCELASSALCKRGRSTQPVILPFAPSYSIGFENIVNADISRVAIYQMAETYKAYPMECKLGVILKHLQIH